MVDELDEDPLADGVLGDNHQLLIPRYGREVEGAVASDREMLVVEDDE